MEAIARALQPAAAIHRGGANSRAAVSRALTAREGAANISRATKRGRWLDDDLGLDDIRDDGDWHENLMLVGIICIGLALGLVLGGWWF